MANSGHRNWEQKTPSVFRGNTSGLGKKKEKVKTQPREDNCTVIVFSSRAVLGQTESRLTAKTRGATVMQLKTNVVVKDSYCLLWALDQVKDAKSLIVLTWLSQGDVSDGTVQQGIQHLLCLVLTICHIRWMPPSLSSFWQAVKAN